MHFMVQKEVALRIVANPGETNYGRLSVMLQYQCDCQYLLDVPPGCFKPPPKVDSAVIRLTPFSSPEYDVGDYSRFSSIVQAAFGQRRKTISNSLKSVVDRETILACKIDPGVRAENLSVADFAKLSKALNQ
jgi:16S rRNA (adenine1518-N6/adenine1519-N6)-dimethyltransferase